METVCLPAEQDSRTNIVRISGLIRECYPRLQQFLPSPYVDGTELYEALVSLGHGADAPGPGIVAVALGPKGMALPVANLGGKPKHYLPRAMPANTPGGGISGHVAVFAENVRKFARTA